MTPFPIGRSPALPRPWLALGAALLTAVPGEAALGQSGEPGPLEVEVEYTGELWRNTSGGLRRGTAALGNLDLTARLDAGRLLGWSGTSIFLYGLANHGDDPTALTGDAQVVSNIEAPEAIRLYEAWIEKVWAGAGLSVLAGLYDLNSEFDVVEEAGLFLNSSFGIGAELGNSGVNGPSIFPVTSLGLRTRWHPADGVYVQGALLDGVPGDPGEPGATAVRLSREEGALWTAEVGFAAGSEEAAEEQRPEAGRARPPGGEAWKVGLGVWQYTRKTEGLAGGPMARAHPGLYLLAESRPWRGEGEREVGVFFRVGTADARTNRFAAYVGTGLTWRGALRNRAADAMGLGVAVARNGRPFRQRRRREGRPVSATETTVEATYRLRLRPSLAVQPDVQVVLDPDTDPALDPAVVVGLRATLSF